ncbi:MAG: hypothetical protein KGZ69_04800 [Methylomonas sp.]|nr:hypothetical protein [Methylomonas sp.]
MRLFECFVHPNPIRIFCREQYINKTGEKLIGNSRCEIVIFRNCIAFVPGRYNYIITIVYLSISLGISSGMELPSGENGIMTSPLANSNLSQKAALTPFDFWLTRYIRPLSCQAIDAIAFLAAAIFPSG